MKRAIFTLLLHQRWAEMRRLSLMFLIVWLSLGMKSAHAQISTLFSSTRDTSTTTTLANCSGNANGNSVKFTDDNTIDGLYADSRARRDTVEICPANDKSHVKLITKDFDLETGDTLFAFDGNKAAFIAGKAPTLGTGAGVGVSHGYGGWLNASCDPKTNLSGCLTFLFKTDGDNKKGKGFEFWVDCAERAITLGPVTIPSRKLTIDSAAYAHITIPAPIVLACGDTLPTTSDSVLLQVKNQFGMVCIDTILTYKGIANAVWDTFAIGIYSAEYTLLSDPTKRLIVPFSVQAPALVCNDNVVVPMGSACMIQLVPDDILEHPADTIPDTMYYNMTITIGSGKNKVVKTTTNYDNHGTVTYPIITIQDLKDAGMSICGATATVKIERLYYQIGGTATICNNGIQNASCETIINFTDQSAPFISVTTNIDTLVACDTSGIAKLLSASAIDNCDDELEVSISVVLDEKDPCFNNKGTKNVTKAKVTFSAVDDCGNIGQTTREVTIIRPNPIQHIVRPAAMTLECTDTSFMGQMPGLQIGTIKNGQFTVGDTIDLNTTKYTCGYILTSRDIDIPTTDCGRKMYRYWEIVDWCSPEIGPMPIDTQFIKYTDSKAPTFVDGTGEMLMLNVGAFDCSYDITNIVAPKATDNCSAPSVRLDSVFRIENGLPWGVPTSLYTQLDIDSFQLRWIADDNCHEQLVNDTLMQLVLIKDVTRPTAVCTDRLNISVGSNAAQIDTSDVDGGSYDACGIAKREISRDGVNFGPTVTFTCEDVNDTIQVTLRVTDKNGNTNSCWLNVHPEDKIRPICTPFAPGTSFANGQSVGNTANVRINCNESKYAAIQDKNHPTAIELAAIGGALPEALDNCTNASNLELTPVVLQLGVCGKNIYQRRWVAVDIKGLQSVDTCFQTIAVDLVEDWKITFPSDVTMTCPVQQAVSDSIILKNGNCDRLAVNVDVQMFDVVQDACFKIVKTYHIINWCNYHAGMKPTHNYNSLTIPANKMLTPADISDLTYITYTQIIKVDDQVGPIVTLGAVDSCLLGNHDGTGEVSAENNGCSDTKTFTASATDCVTEVGGSLFHTYKIYRGNIAEVQAGKAIVVDQSTTRTQGNSVIVIAEVEPGTYTAEFTFTDNCGNSSLQRKEYFFKDCTKPTPYLLNGIAIEIMQNTAQIDIWANDFDQGSYDNCTPKDSLEFRIWHISLGFNPPSTSQGVLDSLPKSIVFGCAYTGTQIVRIYVVDECGNFDYASTYTLIQDNMRACEGDDQDNMVGGTIVNLVGERIEGVNISINDGSENKMTTGADGHYQFMLPIHQNYTITPEKNENPLNGVSTFDLVLISKHILGITSFDSPYHYIAADINKSGTITAFDMVQLRQLILNVTSEFPNNSSWRFLDENYKFTSTNPSAENFSEFINIDNLDSERMNTNFIGVKIGDINGSASVNSAVGTEERNTLKTFNLQAKDESVKTGETVKIAFTASEIETIQGYQFTMDFVGLAFEKVEEGVVKAINFNTNLANKGSLTTSWNGEARENETLFTLVFTANTDALLSDLLKISSAYTMAEAYDKTGALMDVNLAFAKTDMPLVFELMQNAPNPFKEETIISFHLPEPGIATIKVLDIQGKVLKTIRGNYAQGYNQVSLNAKSLGATGVLYYQLESANHLANKKMIVIE